MVGRLSTPGVQGYIEPGKSAAMVVGDRVRNVYSQERIAYMCRGPAYQKLT